MLKNLPFLTIIMALTLATPITTAIAASHKNKTANKHQNLPEWGYHGRVDDKHWGELDEKFKQCESGRMQSPINIANPEPAKMAKIKVHYRDVPLIINNNGHTIKINYPKGSYMQIGNKKLDLLQFHFHTPSENLINNHRYPMEMHFVHKLADNSYAVLAVMIKEGKANKTAAKIWRHLPLHRQEPHKFSKIIINGNDLLSEVLAKDQYYVFMGSLTTPPCTEGVKWYMLRQPLKFSHQQIAKFKQAFPHNNARTTQPANHRLVIIAN